VPNGDCHKSTPASLLDGQEITTDAARIADIFNVHFIKASVTRYSGIFPLTRPRYITVGAFYLRAVTSDDVVNLLRSLSSTAIGPSSIPLIAIKSAMLPISNALASIINKSIETCSFPSGWKVAKVLPIFKKGDHKDPTNYRPISILPTLSKIVERAVYIQVMEFLNKRKVLNPHQHGFRKNHSTCTALSEITDYAISGFEEGKFTIAVFVDFSKAFDSILHDILLHKLAALGLSQQSVEWFASYLSNRKQFVQVGTASSYLLSVCAGVPQGSILGPLLFSLLVNDIHSSLKHCSAILYADDTTILIKGSCYKSTVKDLNSDLQSFVAYCADNSLTINQSRTKAMIFSIRPISSDNAPIAIGDSTIQIVDNFKLLGVSLDSALTFHCHVNQLISKLNLCIRLLRKCLPFLPLSKRILLLNAFGIPHVDYCISIYSKTTQSILEPVRVKYHQCCKTVLGLNKYHSTTDALHNLCLLSFDSRVFYYNAIIIYSSIEGFSSTFNNNSIQTIPHHHATRFRNNNFFHSRYDSDRSKFMLKNLGSRLWSGLPVNVRTANSLHQFKSRLYHHLFYGI
jgi:retron-type reverse transcriptase